MNLVVLSKNFRFCFRYSLRPEKHLTNSGPRTWLFALILSLSIFFSARVPFQIAHSQETIEDLYRLFKVAEIRSDFLIILDTSGSMNEENRFENARKALTSFMEAVTPGDYISIVAFDNLPRLLISGKFQRIFKAFSIKSRPNPIPKGIPQLDWPWRWLSKSLSARRRTRVSLCSS